jgi:ABC-type microcin C transport system permease subunit YejE
LSSAHPPIDFPFGGPPGPREIVLTHGAGAPMDSPLLTAIAGAWVVFDVALKNNGVWGRVPTKTDTENQYTNSILDEQKAVLHPMISLHGAVPDPTRANSFKMSPFCMNLLSSGSRPNGRVNPLYPIVF